MPENARRQQNFSEVEIMEEARIGKKFSLSAHPRAELFRFADSERGMRARAPDAVCESYRTGEYDGI